MLYPQQPMQHAEVGFANIALDDLSLLADYQRGQPLNLMSTEGAR